MNYTIIHKTAGRKGNVSSVSITETSFILCAPFSYENLGKRYILFSVFDDGMLCFKLFDKINDSCYTLSVNNTRSMMMRLPRPLINMNLPKGMHKVEKRDGWYIIPTCKIGA